MNRIGGVNRDITDPASILKMVEKLEGEMLRTVIPIFTTSRTAASRCAGIGVLTHEKALSLGVVGPVARASGVPQDLRKAAPYAAYAEMDFDVPVQPAGDVTGPPAGARAGNHGELQDSPSGAEQAASGRDHTEGEQVRLHHRTRPRPAWKRRAAK